MRKIIIVKGYAHEWFRVIDHDADVEEGEYPILDMRRKHGIIAFQLFAGCTGSQVVTLPTFVQVLVVLGIRHLSN